MPYKLRKAPNRDLYWVIAEDGRHKSKEPMPRERAKAQLKALYASENRGSGIVDDAYSMFRDAYNSKFGIDAAIKDSYENIVNTTKDTFTGIDDLDSEFWVKQSPPADVVKFLEKTKQTVIKKVTIRKAPIQKALEYALGAISLGRWEETKKKLGYDSMFHLSLIFNDNIILQKLARVDVGKVDSPPNAEYLEIPVNKEITLGEVMENARKYMGKNFYPYDPFYNNCQDFADAVMEANKEFFRYTADDKKFVRQNARDMLSDLPTFMPSFTRAITTLGGLVGGQGTTRWKEEAPNVSANELLDMCKQTYVYLAKGTLPANQIGNFMLVESTPELLLYKVQNDSKFIVAVRGTKETRDMLAWTPVISNSVNTTNRWLNDKFIVNQWKQKHPGTYFGTGHSLGGALCDEMIQEGLILMAVTFNPAIQPKDYGKLAYDGKPLNIRIYFNGDPLYNIFGRFDPYVILISDPTPSWFDWLPNLPAHKLDIFTGQLDDVMLGGSQDGLFDVLDGAGLGPSRPDPRPNRPPPGPPRGPSRPPPPRGPPPPLPKRPIPAGSKTAIEYEEIEDNDVMVDFHNEYNNKRYYNREEFHKLTRNNPPRNPFTRQIITTEEPYKAKIVNLQGTGNKLKLVSVAKSTNKGKKWVATFSNGIKTHFGSAGMDDYTLTKNNEQKELYRKRHAKDLKSNDPTKAGYLSYYLLWNKPTLEASIKDFKKLFSL